MFKVFRLLPKLSHEADNVKVDCEGMGGRSCSACSDFLPKLFAGHKEKTHGVFLSVLLAKGRPRELSSLIAPQV
jgi:hypothetical protein